MRFGLQDTRDCSESGLKINGNMQSEVTTIFSIVSVG